LVAWQRNDVPVSASMKRELANSKGGSSPFRSLAFSAASRRAVAADADNRLFFWHWEEDASSQAEAEPTIRVFGRNADNMVTALALSPQGRVVTVGYAGKHGGVHLWDIETARMVGKAGFSHRGGTANRAAFSRSGEYVVTSDELSSCVWQLAQNSMKSFGHFFHQDLTNLYDRPSAVAFSPNDQEIAFGVGAAVAIINRESMRFVGYLGKSPTEYVPEVSTRPCKD
jgi:WD40 repeat protein